MAVVVDLQNVCDAEIPTHEQFMLWVDATLAAVELKQPAELTIRIVGNAESKTLNKQYRDKDKPTNILSFPFEMPTEIEAQELAGLLGDLVICANVVEKEAKQQAKQLTAHWAHMCIHGTLHLLGFDHLEQAEAGKMESIEIDLLSSLGYADPYQLK